jgi:hypothetical protein
MAVTAPAIVATGVAVANPTGQNCSVTILTGTVQQIAIGYGTNPPPAVTTPPVPATTVTATNSSGYPVMVTVTNPNGATITAVTVAGSGVGTTVGSYLVAAGATVAISYTVAVPVWSWAAVLFAVTGAPITLATSGNLPVPPGASITLWYTSTAPTWAWNNFINESYTPGFYAMNNSAEGAGFNPYTQLPYAGHTGQPVLGTGGLGVGVAN